MFDLPVLSIIYNRSNSILEAGVNSSCSASFLILTPTHLTYILQITGGAQQ